MKTNIRSISIAFFTDDWRFVSVHVQRIDDRMPVDEKTGVQSIACHDYENPTSTSKRRLLSVASAHVAAHPAPIHKIRKTA